MHVCRRRESPRTVDKPAGPAPMIRTSVGVDLVFVDAILYVCILYGDVNLKILETKRIRKFCMRLEIRNARLEDFLYIFVLAKFCLDTSRRLLGD